VSLLFNLPVIGPLLMLAVLVGLLMWAPFMSSDGSDASPEQARAARCAALMQEWDAKRSHGIAASRPAGC